MTGEAREAGKARPRRSGAAGTVGRIADHPLVEAGARAGYAVNGVLHLLLAWLALQVAFGNRGADADPAGAFGMLAKSPVGWVLLVVVAVAFGLLALWQVGEALRARETGDKAKDAAKAVVYLALGIGAVSILRGTGESGAAQAKDATTALLELPFGVALVVLAGAGVVAVGGYLVFKGWTDRFLRDLDGDPGRAVVLAGRIGYIAKGIALAAVGVGLALAGLQHDPSRSRGLDGALNDLVRLPLGQALVVVVALGFAAYGFYSFARARHTA